MRYVHLVFVAKYRHHVLNGAAIEALRDVFTKVCAYFGAELRGNAMAGMTTCICWSSIRPRSRSRRWADSLKGVSPRLPRQRRPDIIPGTTGKALSGPHPTSLLPAVAPRSALCADVQNSNGRPTNSCRRRRASRPYQAMNSQACRRFLGHTRNSTDAASFAQRKWIIWARSASEACSWGNLYGPMPKRSNKNYFEIQVLSDAF